MPIYEYRCVDCGKRFEKLVRTTAAQPEVMCPNCGSKRTEKLFSGLGASSFSHKSDLTSSGFGASSGRRRKRTLKTEGVLTCPECGHGNGAGQIQCEACGAWLPQTETGQQMVVGVSPTARPPRRAERSDLGEPLKLVGLSLAGTVLLWLTWTYLGKTWIILFAAPLALVLGIVWFFYEIAGR
jgi:putative FmdB family regulatory protein